MAWTAEEDFDDYADSTSISGLNGGTGFSAGWVLSGGTLTTTSAVTFNGNRSITATSAGLGGNNAERQLTSDVSGSFVFYIAMRRSSTSSGELRWNFRNTADSDSMSVVMNASGNIVIGSTTPITVSSYSADTWYVVRVTGSTDTDTYTAAVAQGNFGDVLTFGAESASKSFQNTATAIRYVLVDLGAAAGTGVTNYWDYLSPTNPFNEPTPYATVAWLKA